MPGQTDLYSEGGRHAAAFGHLVPGGQIVQRAVVYVLEAIYEADFLGFSYGFRPGRGQHDALDALHAGLLRKNVNWVLDADIQGFFSAMSHDWTMRFLEHRIADKRILRLIAKWLKVGVVTKEGRIERSTRGAPQGAVISPALANAYLHYALDLWVHRWRRNKASGDVIVIRYADDFIAGFQHEREARVFLQDLQERLRKFELALHPAKTRLIRFGRHAAREREKRGEGKPETFDFLGFTHFCSRTKKTGKFSVGRKTIKKRMVAKLRALKLALRKRMHDSIAATGGWLKLLLTGHLNYFAVPGNSPSLWWFFNEIRWLWLRSLRRRSQKAFLSWEKFIKLTGRFFRQSRSCIRSRCTALTPEPKGGARCVSSARRDLRGGRGAILVSTATSSSRLATEKPWLRLC